MSTLLWRSSESLPRTLPHFSPQFLDFCQTFIFKLLPFKISFFKTFNRRKLFTFNYYLSRSLFVVVVVQSLSRVWLLATGQASLSFTVSWSLLKFMSIESVMLSNHLSLCHPRLLLPSVFPSIKVFSSDFSGLISFRIYWFGLLAIQRTLKRLLSTTIRKHQFFCTQPSLWSNSHIRTWLLEKP